MLYSKAYSYHKFLHGEMQESETPEQALCGIALAVSLLFPLVTGLYLLVNGFHSPTDGGTVTGKDAFALGFIFGCVPAVPAAVISLIWMIGNRKRRPSGIYTVKDDETGTEHG